MAVPDTRPPIRRPAWDLPLHVAALLILNLTAGMAAKALANSFGKMLPCIVLGCIMASAYGARLWLWLRIGRRWQLSFVYPLLSLNYPLAGLAGYLVFEETMRPTRIGALLLIAGGVILVAQSPNRSESAPVSGAPCAPLEG